MLRRILTILSEAIGVGGLENSRKTHSGLGLTGSSTSGHSPHYVFHSALGQINELESMWRVHPFSERAQQQVARRVLDLWQAELDDFHAGEYIAELWNLAAHYHDNRGRELITVSELEAPPPSGG